MRPSRLLPYSAIAAGLTLAAFLIGGGQTGGAQSQSTIGLMAVDPDINGNTATSLGPLDACVTTQVGALVITDVTVNEVPADRSIIGFDVSATYDNNLFDVIAVDYNYLLGASGTYAPLVAFSDKLPDTDGSVRVSLIDTAVDVANNENIESGPGVLFRITLRTKAAGVGDLSIRFDPPDHYPSVLDKNNSIIQVDQVAVTKLAVGQACPAPPAGGQPQPTIVPLPSLEVIYGTSVPTLEGVTPSATRTLAPGETPVPTRTLAPGETPIPTDGPRSSPTGTPTPSVLPAAGDDDSSPLVPILIAGILAAVGIAAGVAGWRMLRKRRTSVDGN